MNSRGRVGRSRMRVLNFSTLNQVLTDRRTDGPTVVRKEGIRREGRNDGRKIGKAKFGDNAKS